MRLAVVLTVIGALLFIACGWVSLVSPEVAGALAVTGTVFIASAALTAAVMTS